MKLKLLILLIGLCLSARAQTSETENVKITIVKFFDAFHKQDSEALRLLVKDNITLQSISTNNEGKTVLKTDDFNQFLKSIVSIPKDTAFEEKLLDFNIQIDGNMANVWTPYEFWYQGKFSHCGVNSFQLIKQNDVWKIFFLVDTRRRDHCGNSEN